MEMSVGLFTDLAGLHSMGLLYLGAFALYLISKF